MTRIYQPVETTAKLIMDTLVNGPPRSFAELMDETGLTGPQITWGLWHIREVLAKDTENPIVCEHDGETFRYTIAPSLAAAKRYVAQRVSILRTYAQNLRTGTNEPAVARWAGAKLRRVQRDILRVEEDLNEILEEIGA
jgi:hypothetical protein